MSSGLIPAHAGKTVRPLSSATAAEAHPRSRGENVRKGNRPNFGKGSSPLTRGKLRQLIEGFDESRLIPAHAGKTRTWGSRRRPGRAHPRSRGENELTDYVGDADNGSSPLTRGKPTPINGHVVVGWLIPAHAGKTGLRTRRASVAQAHPRSRGENLYSPVSQEMCRGSSPLTRGKRDGGVVDGDEAGLIPAHAGKTWRQRLPFRLLPAHPRSRGENSCGDWSPSTHAGSSPLTRGKPDRRTCAPRQPRLIPAHAGKTRWAPCERSGCAAHPRSRGENLDSANPHFRTRGSSPLTRGKHSSQVQYQRQGGLIPAHAGKTTSPSTGSDTRSAHPRSRGEN